MNDDFVYRKIDVTNKVLTSSYAGESRVENFRKQNYFMLKNECVKSRRLFVDPEFPASEQSIFYSKPLRFKVKWMRPNEIVRKPEVPKFIVDTANANDLDQGFLGNCWFIAACAAITYAPPLFKKVVPQDQECSGSEYAGIYHFRFWIYGIWHDVVIDDLLPVYEDGSLIFCRNKEEPNEFWAALLEKAYAKVCGSYENLEGGFTSDALIDMSGGLEETIVLSHRYTMKEKTDLWRILCRSRQLKSMNAAYIEPDPYVHEAKLPNGLIKGHAYTITKVATLVIGVREVCLIRLRNPWGNEYEWKGAWSDNSREWNQISDSIKKELNFVKLAEGEFWMSLEDFLENFDSVQFCHLTPESLSEEILKITQNSQIENRLTWKMIAYHGEWSVGYSAGGCGNGNNQIFWTNPQFLIKLDKVDDYSDNESDEDLSTVIISLMQKFTREKRTQRRGYPGEEHIHFRLFRVINPADIPRAIQTKQKFNATQLDRVGDSGSYVNKREVTQRFRVAPGHYLIIPSTFDANIPGEFLIRVFTEESIDKSDTHILSEHGICSTPPDPFLNERFFSAGWNSMVNNSSGAAGLGNETRQFVKVNFSGNVSSLIDSGLGGLFNPLYQKIDVEEKRNKRQACSIM